MKSVTTRHDHRVGGHAPTPELCGQIKRFYPDVTEHIRWSETALSRIADELADYDTARSTIRSPADKPLPDRIVEAILDERAAEIRQKVAR
jgi:uncharacterized protein YdhG (YjbR/CyaY superfamily)